MDAVANITAKIILDLEGLNDREQASVGFRRLTPSILYGSLSNG